METPGRLAKHRNIDEPDAAACGVVHFSGSRYPAPAPNGCLIALSVLAGVENQTEAILEPLGREKTADAEGSIILPNERSPS